MIIAVLFYFIFFCLSQAYLIYLCLCNIFLIPTAQLRITFCCHENYLLLLIFPKCLFCHILIRVKAVKPKRPVHPQERSQGHQRPLLQICHGNGICRFFKTEERRTKPLSDIIHEEVTSYKATGCISVDEDPLAWWKSNEHKYPHIAKLSPT